ncbi:MAG: SUMF1/EgtB/PvdO family nonheme iron enzyme [Lentisphaerales bacterium]|nr:SUMF1/EgtB/PvdO family nonheme iron enzyme [Lentisphaerales bacterium]
MSEPKKLKIKSGNNTGIKKKLIVKNEGKSDQGLIIKKPLPELPETPTPNKGLKIKSSSGEYSQAEQSQQKGLKIKSSSGEYSQAEQPQQKGLKIKSSSGEYSQAEQPQQKGLKIKGTVPPAQQQQPTQGLMIKGTVPPVEPKVDLNATLIPENRTSPPPMPTGYAPPPPPAALNSQGPIFPNQQQPVPGQQPPPMSFGQQPATNPQGPIFPNQQQPIPGQQPPGTIPTPVQRPKTAAPLSAIMGEVRAARKITPTSNPAPQPETIVKVKKPTPSIKDSLGNDFCLIKEGTYYCGIDNEVVTLNVPFTIAKYPVIKKDFFEFLKSSDIEYSSEELNKLNQIAPYPNSPAVLISWEDAKNYCRWLRETTGEYYALPSINEWEMAARGQDGRAYPWGDDAPTSQICCFNDGYMEPQSTATVNYFAKNISPSGCVGMVGNIMEWTLNSFDDEREPHILKGGGWSSPLDFCNSVTPCMSYPPTKRQEFVGFRLLYLPKELYQNYRDNLLNA